MKDEPRPRALKILIGVVMLAYVVPQMRRAAKRRSDEDAAKMFRRLKRRAKGDPETESDVKQACEIWEQLDGQP